MVIDEEYAQYTHARPAPGGRRFWDVEFINEGKNNIFHIFLLEY